MYFRSCPICNREISHENKTARNNGVRKNNPCRACSLKHRVKEKKPKNYSAICQECKTERMYSTANKIVLSCKSCTAKKVHAANPNRLKGSNNPMFGKNPLAQLSDERMQKLKHIRSQNAKGERNPMFGKPAPEKSGRGYSGRWNGISFRSLLELSFLEWFYHSYGHFPQTAETKEMSIPLPSGRTYFPDFTYAGVVYEIKPSKLLTLNAEKINAGKLKYGNKFIVMTEQDLPYKDISKRLKFFENLQLHREVA